VGAPNERPGLMPMRIFDQTTLEEYFPKGKKKSEVMSPEWELAWLFSAGKSTARLDRCLEKKPNVNFQQEMGCTPLMFATAAWSPQFVTRLLEEKADPNITDRNGATAMNFCEEMIKNMETAAEDERKDCRRRRLIMEVTGTLLPDRPNVEDLEPFNGMDHLYNVKKILENAGAKSSENVRRPGYD